MFHPPKEGCSKALEAETNVSRLQTIIIVRLTIIIIRHVLYVQNFNLSLSLADIER